MQLEELPQDVLIEVLARLPAPALGAMAQTCRRLRDLVYDTDVLWLRLLRRHFFDLGSLDVDLGSAAASPAAQARALLAHGPPCSLCAQTLERPPLPRCPCVCRRARLPLRLVSLSQARCGSSCLVPDTFGQMLAALNTCFELRLSLEDTLSEEALAEADMLVVCTTEGQALDATEAAAVQAFVRRGGTALLSAFSNWSQFGHYNAMNVRWLGVEVLPHSPFRMSGVPVQLPNTAAFAPIAHGAFGDSPMFLNKGHTNFMLRQGALAAGVVPLAAGSLENSLSCAFVPRGSATTGAGQVLVLTNLHCLADPTHWHGGFGDSASNQAFFRNLAATAVAARHPPAHTPANE